MIQGSGRPKGNTAQLISSFKAGCEGSGHSVEVINMINYMGFHDKGMVLAGGCGDTNGKPQINKTNHLQEAYEFGKNLY